MSDTGRLIINARGESAKAIGHDGKVTVQATALYDRCTVHYDAPGMWKQCTTEVEFTKREAAALALQILDAAGYAAQIMPRNENTKALRDARRVGNVERIRREAGLPVDIAPFERKL